MLVSSEYKNRAKDSSSNPWTTRLTKDGQMPGLQGMLIGKQQKFWLEECVEKIIYPIKKLKTTILKRKSNCFTDKHLLKKSKVFIILPLVPSTKQRKVQSILSKRSKMRKEDKGVFWGLQKLKLRKSSQVGLGAVAHDCNPSTFGGQNGQITWGQEFRTSLPNMVKPLSTKKYKN